MALRIVQNEVLSPHIGVMQRLLLCERLMSSSARPAAVVESLSNVKEGQQRSSEGQSKVLSRFRTTENDPRNHNESHLFRYYTVPKDIQETHFKGFKLPKHFGELCHAFTETCIMVRKPFLEVKSYVEQVDFSKPAVRIVLYGEYGLGKSLTLTHVVHYAYNAGFMIVHVPWVNHIMRRCVDVSPSETKPGLMDLPIDGSAWLTHFRNQNQHLLSSLGLKTTKSYKYGPRDVIEAGQPLDNLVEFGVSRAKYSCDVIEDLLKEVKTASNNGLFKTMVIIDGFNGFFSPYLRTSHRKIIKSKSTFALPFLDMTRFDWCNGISVLSVDRISHPDWNSIEGDLPHVLLGREGFEHLDPFVPVKVSKLNNEEMNTMIDYYVERRWIQPQKLKGEEGRAELRFLCAGNGLQLLKLCSPL